MSTFFGVGLNPLSSDPNDIVHVSTYDVSLPTDVFVPVVGDDVVAFDNLEIDFGSLTNPITLQANTDSWIIEAYIEMQSRGVFFGSDNAIGYFRTSAISTDYGVNYYYGSGDTSPRDEFDVQGQYPKAIWTFERVLGGDHTLTIRDLNGNVLETVVATYNPRSSGTTSSDQLNQTTNLTTLSKDSIGGTFAKPMTSIMSNFLLIKNGEVEVNAPMNEGSGLTSVDYSGNNNDIILTNPTWTTRTA